MSSTWGRLENPFGTGDLNCKPLPAWRRMPKRLKEEDAQAILDARPERNERGHYTGGTAISSELAGRYGVTRSTVIRIWDRRGWCHLERKKR